MNILLVSDNRYPDADAGAVREKELASMLLQRGHTLFRAGRFTQKDAIIEGVTCFSVPDNGKKRRGNIRNLLQFNRNIIRLVKENHRKFNFDAFLITGCKPRVVKALKHFAKKKQIILVYNSVEYYSPNQFRLGRFSRHFMNNRCIADKVIDSSFGVISISSFLDQMFCARGIRSVRIPFVLSCKTVECKIAENERLEITYVGRPARRKDYLKEFVDALTELSKDELDRIHLTIVGVDRQQLKDVFRISQGVIDSLGKSLDAMGLLPRQEAMEILSRADFAVLYRSKQEVYAQAGFPTKFCESMMSGVPMITNLTSDLGMYLKDGENGFVISEDCGIADCYRKAIHLSRLEIRTMKLAARKTAEEKLDSIHYLDVLNSLFTKE